MGVAMDIFQPIVDLITEAIGTTMVELGTFWIGVDTEPVDDPSGPVKWLQGELDYLVFAVATVAVIIAGVKMAFGSRGEAARDVLRSLLTLVVVMFLGLSVIGLLVKAGDEMSKCLIASSITPGLGSQDPAQLDFSDLHPPSGWQCDVTSGTRKDFGANILAALGMTGPGGAALGIVGIMFIGIWAIMASVIQIAMMIVRNGMLVVLIGVLPLAAAATNTEAGRMWFKRCLSWLVAFLLYKPMAAFVYAAALKLMSESALATTSAENATQFAVALKNGITAAVMMTLAILALPALMKFLTPLVAAAAGGAGLMATMTSQGMAANQLVSAGNDDGSGDPGGPTGASNAGGSQRASSASGRRGQQGATGPHGAGGRRGRSGSQGTAGQGTAGQGQSRAGGGTATATAGGGSGGGGDPGDGGSGGSGSSGGSGGSGGAGGGGGGGALGGVGPGGSTGTTSGTTSTTSGTTSGSTGGSTGSGHSTGSGGSGGTGPGGPGPDGVPTSDGPGGAGDLVPGQDGKGPGGAMHAADAVQRISRSVENMGRTSTDAVNDPANEGPSGSN
jgi:hypothetical protein